jgi:hypothetical protein
MSKCLSSPIRITDENYSDVRKENLQKLINRYQTLSNNLIELENSPNQNQDAAKIKQLNDQIYNLQNNIFENNSTSINRIEEQKNNITLKNNSSNINKTIIQRQNELLSKNDSLISLANTQFKQSQERKSSIDKMYTFLSLFIIVLVIVTIVLILKHSDLDITASASPSASANAYSSSTINSVNTSLNPLKNN